MKKYILAFSIFVFTLILTGFNATASASNCAAGDLFNSTTGNPCNNTISCRVLLNNGLKIGSRGDDVRAFQQTLKEEGFLAGKVDGIYGPVTDSASVSYYRKCPSNNSTVVISGVSGPQSLNINQQGTWTVTAYNSSGGNLSYSVSWGDEPSFEGSPMGMGARDLVLQQSATFTHSYSQTGIYNPRFIVTSENTTRCITTPCTSKGGSAQTSLSVNVGNVTNSPSITVLSPNGGEEWVKGTTQTINWQDNTPLPKCSTDPYNPCFLPQRLYDITLSSYYPPCTGICPMNASYPYRAPYTIAKGVTGTSYSWPIPNCGYPYPCSNDSFETSPGSYTIQVCQSGTSVCDSSNSYFQITSGKVIAQSSFSIVPSFPGCLPPPGYNITRGKPCSI